MKFSKIQIISFVAILFLTSCSVGAGQNSAGGTANRPQIEAEPLSTDLLSDSGNLVLELIAASFSEYNFAGGEVPQRDVELILMCGLKAPSAKNAQPWHFTVVRNYETTSQLLRHAKDGNVIIVISGNPDITTDTMAFDCGLATQNMQLAAEALGYGARIYIEPIWEIDRNWRDGLGIPGGYEVLAALLIGNADTDAVSYATPRNTLSSHVNYAD